MNALKPIWKLAVLMLAGWGIYHPAAEVTGQWNFENGDLSATLGRDLEYFDGPGGATESETVFGTTTELGIPDIGGQAASVMGFPKSLSSMGYVIYPEMQANGGGQLVNQYSIVMDILFPAGSAGQWRALMQLEDVWNFSEADIFVNPANGAGAAGQFHGQLPPDQWRRLAITVDLIAASGPTMTVYIDGTKAGEHVLPQGLDLRWAMNPQGGPFGDHALLFTDGDPGDGSRVQPGFVSSIQVHDVALEPGYIFALGGPSAEGIPTDVSIPAMIRSLAPAPGDRMVLPDAAVEIVIAEGETAIDPQTIQLTLNGEPVTASVERPETSLLVVRYMPEQWPPLSQHSARLTFFDPVAGEEVDTGSWSFRVAPYHLAGAPVPGAIFSMSMDESPVLDGTRIMDGSGHDNHGTFRSESGVDRSMPGAVGNAILFGPEGENYIELDQPWAGTPNTFSAWVNVSTDVPSGTRVGVIAGNFNDPNNINWEMHTAGRPRLYWNAGNPDWNITGIDLRAGQWEHMAFVRDPARDRVTFYRNGAVAAVRDGAGIDITPATASFIGADKRGPNTIWFRGAIDELNVYERPLDDQEIWSLYARSLEIPQWRSETPWIVSVSPEDNAAGVERLTLIEVAIDQNFSETELDTASIELRINGDPVTASVEEANGGFIARHQVTAPLAPASLHTVEIRYSDNASPPALTVKEWSFTTAAGASIVTGPRGQTVLTGQNYAFSVTAEVTPPVSYQWRHNGTALEAPSEPVLILRDIRMSDAGEYSVVVTDAGGAVESEPAVLTVIPRPLDSLVTLPAGPLPDPDPVFHMPMDEESVTAWATISDASQHGNHGSFITDSFEDKSTPGAIGNAILFGPDELEYIELSQPWAGTPNTFSAWVKVSPDVPDGTRAGVIAGNFNAANNINWELHTSGRPRVYWNNGNPDWNISGIDLRTGQWEHIAFVRDPGADQFTFYWNGVPAATRTGAGDAIVPATASFIGADIRGPNTLRFQGAIDEVVIYGRPLSSEEVWKLYSRQAALPDENTFATPPVWSLSPAPGETGAALDAAIEAVLNDSFSQTKVDPSSIQLFLNGSAVSASFEYENGFYMVRHVPPASLAAGAEHTAEIRFQDTDGAAFSESWQFTTVLGPPVVGIPPRARTVRAGTDLSLWVEAAAVPPVSYQWFFNGEPVDGATSDTLVLRDVTAGQSGFYSVRISDGGGSVETAPALLTVVDTLPDDAGASLAIGLTAHWTFDEDFSGEIPGFDGVPHNDPSITSAARIGSGAARFDQANESHVRVNRQVLVDETLEYSVAGWFNLAGGSGRRFMWETAPANWAIAAEVNAAGTIAYFHRDAALTSRAHNTEIEAVVGQWYHLAVVFNGREGFSRIYLDGQDAGAIEHPAGVGTSPTSGFHIGTFRNANGRFFDGEIDDVAVWNRVLTPSEIAHLAAGNRVPGTADRPRIVQAEVSGGTITLHWTGGTPPYQLERRASLFEGAWENVGEPTDGLSASDIAGPEVMFYRLRSAQ